MPAWQQDPRYAQHPPPPAPGSYYDPHDDDRSSIVSKGSHRSGRSKRGRKNNIYKDIYRNFDYQPYDDDLYNDEYKQMNSTEMAGGRKTPPKYGQPHCIVRFSPTGQIVKVSPTSDSWVSN